MLSIINAIKDINRARQIATVLAKHGFGEMVSRIGLGGLLQSRVRDEVTQETAGASTRGRARITLPERLRLVLQELGPSFIKLGQIISTRPDVVPADVIEELRKLQDDVPPIRYEEVEQTIERTLGAPIESIFVGFEREPLACASIGQVHRARLRAEEALLEVVVKVQRPGIRSTIERDIDLLYLFARLIERTIPESKIYSPSGMVREFDQAIMAELDFNLEADNAERFARNFAGSDLVCFPRVYREASSKQVLTLEFFDGRKIGQALVEGHAGDVIARRALRALAQMIFEDGFFHADPHPGNILIMGSPEAPVVGMLDLGLVGRISAVMRERIVDLMMAAIRADTEALASALLAIGRPRGPLNMDAFRAEVAQLSEKYLGRPIHEIEVSAMITDLVQGAVKYEIEMPTEMLMMGKALMTIEGVGKVLYPQLDVFKELRPYFARLLLQRYHPARVGREVLRTMGQLKHLAQDLPEQLNAILDDLRSGRLELQVCDPHLPASTDRLGRRLYASVTTGAMTLAAALLLAFDRHFYLGWVLLLIAATLLLIHVWGDWRRKHRKYGALR